MYTALIIKLSVPCYFQFTIFRDLLPGIGRVHEGRVMDLIIDILVFIERECPTETDVHNNADWPHVQWAVIALVQQNLWGQIGRCAHHWAAERLLTDDTSKAKVT